jgi:hypothetical protein
MTLRRQKVVARLDEGFPLPDPITSLPAELVAFIFSFIPFKQLLSLLAVSRTWQTIIKGTPSLWTSSICIDAKYVEKQNFLGLSHWKLVFNVKAYRNAPLDTISVRHMRPAILKILSQGHPFDLNANMTRGNFKDLYGFILTGVEKQSIKRLYFIMKSITDQELIRVLEETSSSLIDLQIDSLVEFTGKKRRKSLLSRLSLTRLVLSLYPLDHKLVPDLDYLIADILLQSKNLQHVQINYVYLSEGGPSRQALKNLNYLKCLSIGVLDSLPMLNCRGISSLRLLIDSATTSRNTISPNQVSLESVRNMEIGYWLPDDICPLSCMKVYNIGSNVLRLILSCPWRDNFKEIFMRTPRLTSFMFVDALPTFDVVSEAIGLKCLYLKEIIICYRREIIVADDKGFTKIERQFPELDAVSFTSWKWLTRRQISLVIDSGVLRNSARHCSKCSVIGRKIVKEREESKKL